MGMVMTEFGMSLDTQALHHVAAFSDPEVTPAALAMHLTVDHEVPSESVMDMDADELAATHLSLHGHVMEIRDDEK